MKNQSDFAHFGITLAVKIPVYMLGPIVPWGSPCPFP